MGQRKLKNKLHRQILCAAKKQGWGIRPTRQGYWLMAPDGVSTYAFHCGSSTPSDYRADRNLVAALRRAGMELDVTTR